MKFTYPLLETAGDAGPLARGYTTPFTSPLMFLRLLVTFQIKQDTVLSFSS